MNPETAFKNDDVNNMEGMLFHKACNTIKIDKNVQCYDLTMSCYGWTEHPAICIRLRELYLIISGFHTGIINLISSAYVRCVPDAVENEIVLAKVQSCAE